MALVYKPSVQEADARRWPWAQRQSSLHNDFQGEPELCSKSLLQKERRDQKKEGDKGRKKEEREKKM